MPNELTFTGSLSFNKALVTSSAIGRSFTALQFNVAGTLYVQGSILVTVAGVAIPLGQVTAPHWAVFVNLDPTNFLRIANGQTGAKLIKIRGGSPGEPCIVPLDDTSTPWAFADTASVEMEYLIISL